MDVPLVDGLGAGELEEPLGVSEMNQEAVTVLLPQHDALAVGEGGAVDGDFHGGTPAPKVRVKKGLPLREMINTGG